MELINLVGVFLASFTGVAITLKTLDVIWHRKEINLTWPVLFFAIGVTLIFV